MKIYSVVGEKGGSGKTRLNLGISCQFACRPTGGKVLLIDGSDNQGTLSFMYARKIDERGCGLGCAIEQVLAGLSGNRIKSVLQEGMQRVYIDAGEIYHIDILAAAHKSLGKLSHKPWKEKEPGEVLSIVLEVLYKEYDYCVIDLKPDLDSTTVKSTLSIADKIILLQDVELLENIAGLAEWIDVCSQVSKEGSRVIAGIVANKYNAKVAASKEALAYVQGACDANRMPLLTIIPNMHGIMANIGGRWETESGEIATGPISAMAAGPVPSRKYYQALMKQFDLICEALEA